MEENYLFDSYRMEGKDMNGFIKQCKILDEHTDFVKIDFSNDVSIFQFSQLLNGKAEFLMLSPGIAVKEMYNNRTHHKEYSISHVYRTLNIYKNENNKVTKEKDLSYLISEMQGYGGTAYFWEHEDGHTLLFPGKTSNKSFHAMPVTHTNASLERNLLLAKELADNKVKLFVTVRRNNQGNGYGKIISFFSSRDGNERTPFSTVVDAVNNKDFGSGKCIKWTSDQKSTKLYYSFDNEVEYIRKNFPEVPYIPVHILCISDSGHKSNCVESAWMCPDTMNRISILSKTSYVHSKTRSYEFCINESMKNHLVEAASITKDMNQRITLTEDITVKRLFDIATAGSNVNNTIGKKPLNIIKDYAEEKYKDATDCTIFEVKSLVMKAVEEGLFDNTTPNIQKQLPEAIGDVLLSETNKSLSIVLDSLNK